MPVSNRLLQLDSLAKLTRTSNTVITLGSLTVTTSISGVNGLDTDTIAASSFYYVYAVNSSGVKLVASLSAVAPTGFSTSRKVGAFYTDGSSNVFKAYYFSEFNETVLSAYINSAAVPSSQVPFAWVQTGARSGTANSAYSANFIANIFTVVPIPFTSSESSQIATATVSATSTTVSVSTAASGSQAQVGFTLMVRKVGIDAVQPDWTR